VAVSVEVLVSREAMVSGAPAEGTGEAERGDEVLERVRSEGRMRLAGFGEGLGETARGEDALAIRLRSALPRDGTALH
jgi:hypothetical protein